MSDKSLFLVPYITHKLAIHEVMQLIVEKVVYVASNGSSKMESYGQNWEHLAQNEIEPFRAAAVGSQGFLLDASLFVLNETIGATPSLLLEELVDMVGITYLQFEYSKSKGRRNVELLKMLEADVEARVSNVNIVETGITAVIKNLTPNCFGAVLKPTWSIHVAKLLKCYPSRVFGMIVKLVMIGRKMMLALPLLISSISVSSLKLKSGSATQACLLEGKIACAKASYGAFSPVVIYYNAELCDSLELITEQRPEAFAKEMVSYQGKLQHSYTVFLGF